MARDVADGYTCWGDDPSDPHAADWRRDEEQAAAYNRPIAELREQELAARTPDEVRRDEALEEAVKTRDAALMAAHAEKFVRDVAELNGADPRTVETLAERYGVARRPNDAKWRTSAEWLERSRRWENAADRLDARDRRHHRDLDRALFVVAAHAARRQARPTRSQRRTLRARVAAAHRGPPRPSGDDDPPSELARWRGLEVASAHLHAHTLRRAGARKALA